jgi:predicted Zn-dependent protease
MKRVRNLAINAADHLVAMHRLEAAASILDNYLNAHDDCPLVLRRLGRIRLAQRKPRAAARAFERALASHKPKVSASESESSRTA